MTWPSSAPLIRAKLTRLRFTAFSMSSTHMNTTMALRRTSTPTAPIEKSISVPVGDGLLDLRVKTR